MKKSNQRRAEDAYSPRGKGFPYKHREVRPLPTRPACPGAAAHPALPPAAPTPPLTTEPQRRATGTAGRGQWGVPEPVPEGQTGQLDLGARRTLMWQRHSKVRQVSTGQRAPEAIPSQPLPLPPVLGSATSQG